MGMKMFFRKRSLFFIGLVILISFAGGCGRPSVRQPASAVKTLEKKAVSRLGYTIQAGAFANAENADREVSPTARLEELGEAYNREALVRFAQSFLGVPYLWGGASVETGFDCSGLTMTVYQLNGFDLPRTSREQFAVGNPVDRSSLEKGDLLFFSRGGGKVSHVGIYAGNGRFIHAAGRGKRIRMDILSKGQYSRIYFGARSYL